MSSERLARAARIHGRDKVAVGEVVLPPIGDDELLLRVVSSSMCLSTYKALSLGEEHKRVPDDLAGTPVITGHEFAGVLEEVGPELADRFSVGQRVAILPTMGLPSGYSPGYSYPYFGGRRDVLHRPQGGRRQGLRPRLRRELLRERLAGRAHVVHHRRVPRQLSHASRSSGSTRWASAAVGRWPCWAAAARWGSAPSTTPCTVPTGPAWWSPSTSTPSGSSDCAASSRPRRRRSAGRSWCSSTRPPVDARASLLELSDGQGYDDVVVFAAVKELAELGDGVLGRDGCLNFFAGPTDKVVRGEPQPLQRPLRGHARRRHLGRIPLGHGGVAEALCRRRHQPVPHGDPRRRAGGRAGRVDEPAVVHRREDPDLPAHRHGAHRDRGLRSSRAKEDPRYAELAQICAANDHIWDQDAERHVLEASPARDGPTRPDQSTGVRRCGAARAAASPRRSRRRSGRRW